MGKMNKALEAARKARKGYNMYNFIKKYKWSRPIVGKFFILISPLYVPIMILWNYRKEIIEFYKQCWILIKGDLP